MTTLRTTHGFVRTISRSLAQCELLHLARQPFDLALAARQHAGYVRALQAAGVSLTILPEEPELPDAVFVEDPVLILDELAIICRPGTSSRIPETERIAPNIAKIRPLHRIAPPGTVEGGDILRIGQVLYTGSSTRTNADGIRQLETIVSHYGYRVVPVPVHGCLHLKTGVTSPSPGILIANPRWIDLSPFHDFEILPVPPAEPWGANTLPVNDHVLVSDSSPHTARLLESRGLRLTRLHITELQKAEAGVTCLSLLYSTPVAT